MTLNPTSAVQAQLPADKQANSAAPEVAFNQVLSGELASRRNASAADQAAETATDTSAQARPANTGGAQPASPEPAEEATDGARADSETTLSVSAELLAMVANLSQTTVQSTQPRTSSAAPDSASVAVDPGHARNKGKSALSAHAELQALSGNMQSPGVAPVNPDPRLASATLQANESKPAFDFNVAKTAELLPSTPAAAMAPLQQAALTMAQAVSGHPQEKLTPAVGTAAWDQALGQKVVWMTAGGQQTASLTLNPPDLGPLQVVLNISNDQANATFTAAQPEVRQALEAALPKLREMMGDAGIQLGEATINAGTANQHGASSRSSQQAPGAFNNRDEQRDTPIQGGGVPARTSGLGLVDTFA